MDDRFFDPYLTCSHAGFPAFTAELIRRLEVVARPRCRARRSADAERHEKLIGSVAANVTYAALIGKRVAVPLRKPTRKRSRYEPGGIRQLAPVLELLDKAGLVVLDKSATIGKASTIEPLPEFVDAAEEHMTGFTLGSFVRVPGGETIILTQTTVDRTTDTRRSELVDYPDTPETIRYREEMERINAYLASADIEYVGPERDRQGRRIVAAPSARFLHRTFNIPSVRFPVRPGDKRFDRGGRLYHRGVFWQGLPGDLRQFIRIDEEPIAYLDFKSMFLRLAHAEVGVEPPPGDLYRSIRGIETEGHRRGIKVVVNAMLFRDTPLTRLPRAEAGEPPIKALLPKSLAPAKAARAAVLDAFPALREVFERGRGFSLMFTESQILVVILLKLNAEGITVMPIHDGMMVAASRADEAEALINQLTHDIFGFSLPLDRKEDREGGGEDDHRG